MTTVFWACLAVLLTGSLAGLLRPFLRRSIVLQGPSPDLAVYRRQQTEIAADLAAGLLDGTAAEEAQAEIARRALRFEAEAATAAPVPTSKRVKRVAAASLALAVPVATISLYLALGQPSAIGRAANAPGEMAGDPASPHTSGELAASATKLADRLAQDPKDANGWVLLGRTYAALDRYGEAADAFSKAIALVPGEPSLHAQRGEVLALAAEGMVTDEAAAEFNQAGDDPRARFYLAAQAAQAGRTDEAIDRLKKLLADAPAEANWRSMVVDALDELGVHDAGSAPTSPAPAMAAAPPATAAPRGPTGEQMAAAAQMSAGDRETMIRGMVEGLAARLETDPSDKAGWARLANAYEVLGEKDKAAAAHARATGGPAVAAPAPVAAAVPAPANPLEAKAQALAARLQSQPNDAAGWLDLARTYRGLGREADAMATLKQANQKMPGTLDLLTAYADGLSKANQGEKLSTDFIEIMTQINAIDGDQPDALWYLGLAAEQRGDGHRARAYWNRLVAHLPDGDERTSVRRRLAKLP